MKLNFSKNSGNFELIVWTVYYLLMFTIGRYEALKQVIIWGGAFLAFGLTAPFIYRNFKKIPKETLWLMALWVWSLTGGLVAINMDGYLHYLRMIAQMVLVIIFFGTVCRKSEYTGLFTGIVIIPPLFILGDMLLNQPLDSMAMDLATQTTADRAFGLANDPNAFGVMCCVGIWAALKLVTEYKNKLLRIALIVAIVTLIYSILLSASRSAFIICTFEIAAWLIFCIPYKVRIKGIRLVVICLVLLVFMFALEWVFENTVLGARSMRALEETEDESRVKLIIFGLELFMQSPIIGHGLAQFVELSPTKHYAHNDLVELLATTGFPGALFYYLFFFVIGFMLLKNLRRYKNSPNYIAVVMNLILLAMFFVSGMFNANFASMEWAFFNALLVGGTYSLIVDKKYG